MGEVNERDVENVARVCHEANRAWCIANGEDNVLPGWDNLDEETRESATEGVHKALEGATPEELHESWSNFKLENGWSYGEVKDPEAKTHPCLVPYDDLPEQQRVKDALFQGVVLSLTRHWDP